MAGILGKKLGMTNIFDGEGRVVPVTLVEAGPCYVLASKTKDRDGYSALVIGYGEVRESKLKRAQKGFFKKINVKPTKIIREIRAQDDVSLYKIGDRIDLKLFKDGDYVDVTGTSIGKGFQGGVKRYGWHGGGKSHGSMFHRAPGSVGASSYPSRVFKGHGLPGHMGARRRSIQNIKIVHINKDNNVLAMKGSLPGARGSVLFIKHAKKKKASSKPGVAQAPERDEKTK